MKDVLYEVRCLKSNEDMILAQQMCDFIAQLVRALHRHRRGHGFESR